MWFHKVFAKTLYNFFQKELKINFVLPITKVTETYFKRVTMMKEFFKILKKFLVMPISNKRR